MACHCVVLDLFDEELLQAIGKYSKRKLKFKNVELVHSDRSGTKKNEFWKCRCGENGFN